MPEQKMSYQERVKHFIDHFYSDEPMVSNGGQYGWLKKHAIDTVAAQAQAIREALRRWGVREEDIQNELLEHGYIEPADTATPNIESDNPGCLHERLWPGSDNAPYCRDCGEQF